MILSSIKYQVVLILSGIRYQVVSRSRRSKRRDTIQLLDFSQPGFDLLFFRNKTRHYRISGFFQDREALPIFPNRKPQCQKNLKANVNKCLTIYFSCRRFPIQNTYTHHREERQHDQLDTRSATLRGMAGDALPYLWTSVTSL